MNANLQKAFISLFAAVAMIYPAMALSYEFPYLFTDPLRTKPDVVEKGVILPGDTFPIPCSSRPDFTRPLALGEAVDIALCNNQQIKSSWADIKIKAGALGEAYAAYLPVLNSTLNWTDDWIASSNSSSNVNRYTFQASATWSIFDFGGRSANRHSAEFLLIAAISNHDATLQRALAGVIQSYFDAMTASAAIKAKMVNEEIALKTLKSAEVREAKGAISQSDTLRATTALARASLDKNRAHGDYQKALAVLGRVLGLSGGTEILLPQELAEHGGAESRELNLWLEEAQKNHPAIVSARKRLEAAQQQVTVAHSAGLPTLNLAGNYYQNTRPGEAVTPVSSTETTLIVALSLPLFDGFASTYKLRGAQAQIERNAAELADMEQQVAMGVIKAHADATSAMRNLESSAALLDAAQSAIAVSQRKYDKGAADITEVLSTQAALSDAWQERVRCLAEWHSGRLQLLVSAGQMGRFAVAGSSTN